MKKISFDWNYTLSFDGFKIYISELDLNCVSLLIDKEGNGNTLFAAKKESLTNVFEEDSKNSCSIRCADMIAGFISNLIDNLEISLSYNENDQPKDDNHLPPGWFNVSEEVFYAYKLIYKVLVELNNSWFKYYCSIYNDCVIHLTSLLSYFNEYVSYGDYKKESFEYHSLNVNNLVALRLKEEIKEIEQSYVVEFLDLNKEKDFYYNQKGAKCYYDLTKHKMLTLPKSNNSLKYFALSIGFFHEKANEIDQPCIAISEYGVPTCYLLPKNFTNWAYQQIMLSMSHKNPFPCFLIISKDNNGFKLLMSDE